MLQKLSSLKLRSALKIRVHAIAITLITLIIRSVQKQPENTFYLLFYNFECKEVDIPALPI